MTSDQCMSCNHYIGNLRCEAFKKIPIKILTGEHDHSEPFRGDKGLRFVQMKLRNKKKIR